MKAFLLASIYGKKQYKNSYIKIVDVLKKGGHQVAAKHVLDIEQKDLDGWDNEKKVSFHKNVIDGVKKSDIVVAEISYPSISVGYLISLAIDCGKPTIVLYSGEKEPHILSTIEKADRLIVLTYKNLGEVSDVLSHTIQDAKDQMDVRFNFFISPKIGTYLDWISKNKRIPRAVYLRRLIEKDMEKSKEYSFLG